MNEIHIVNSVLALVLTIIRYMCNVILLPSTLYDYRLFVNKEENYHANVTHFLLTNFITTEF